MATTRSPQFVPLFAALMAAAHFVAQGSAQEPAIGDTVAPPLQAAFEQPVAFTTATGCTVRLWHESRCRLAAGKPIFCVTSRTICRSWVKLMSAVPRIVCRQARARDRGEPSTAKCTKSLTQ
jgi:hypothetical protein